MGNLSLRFLAADIRGNPSYNCFVSTMWVAAAEETSRFGNRAWGDQVPKVNVRPRRATRGEIAMCISSTSPIFRYCRMVDTPPPSPTSLLPAAAFAARNAASMRICYKMKSGATFHRDWCMRMVRQDKNGNVIRWVWTPPTFPAFIYRMAHQLGRTCSDQESEAPKFVVPRAAKSSSMARFPLILAQHLLKRSRRIEPGMQRRPACA